LEAKAIHFPSGDQAGQPSKAGLLVILRKFVPSLLATNISEFMSPMILRKAIFFMSGDHDG